MNTWEKLKKVVKPHQIVLLIILIGSNSFAWFIYATKVNNTMDAHVRAWDVLFQSGDSPIVDYVDLNIDDISDYDINNLPKFQRLLAKYADMKYSIIGDNGFFNSFIDLVLPTQKRITSIQDFEKLKKQYHQMRNK